MLCCCHLEILNKGSEFSLYAGPCRLCHQSCIYPPHSPSSPPSRHLSSHREREVAQSCPTLCDPTDCSLPGSSVHGIFQARVLEWGAIAFSSHKAISMPRENEGALYAEHWRLHHLTSPTFRIPSQSSLSDP